jgi:hypothetical protein
MRLLRLAGLLAAVSAWASGTSAGEPAAGARVELLGKDAYIRAHFAFKTPLVAYADGQIKVPMDGGKTPKPLADFETAAPPADPSAVSSGPNGWVKPEFDDSAWPRFQLQLPLEVGNLDGSSVADALGAAENHLICVRARFAVENPAAAGDLKLTVEYVGGAVVRINGREIGRGHLPTGELKPDALAEKYPDNLCVGSDGVLVYATKDDQAKKDALNAARYRRLADVAVPADALRKGVNVLSVEVHRAPANEGTLAAQRPLVGGMARRYGLYAYAGLKSLSLTAPAGSPAAARPGAVSLWRPGRAETVKTTSPADPSGPPSSLEIAGARHGVFSDRLLVTSSSAEPVKALKVTVSELVKAEGGAKFPAEALRVRFAAPFEAKKTHGPADRFDALLDAPPSCRTVPVWITARIPADAAPGRYQGKVSVEAEGLARTEVPLKLTVHDWRLPDTKDFTVKNVGQSMTEQLAEFYGVPRWSEKHFELIGRTMELMAEVNDRSAIVDLTIPGNYAFDNTETLVRWIKQEDGSYKYDFTVFDKYLDVVAKKTGKPLPLRINIFTQIEKKDGKRVFKGGRSVAVSVLDPATGKLDRLESPPMGTPESLPFWKPVLDEVKKKIEARSWWDVVGVGDTQYAGAPDAESLATLKQIWPDVRGVSQQHGLTDNFGSGVRVIVAATVWNEGPLRPRGYKGLWSKKPWLMCGDFARNRHYESSPLVIHRMLPEELIMRNHHGVFPLGQDLWKLYDPRGKEWNVSDNSALGPGCSTRAMLAPGPDGAVVTERFEMFRESVEACEAMIFLQRGLDEGRIAGELATKVNRLLDERSGRFLYATRGLSFAYPGPYNDYRVWQALIGNLADRDGELFALCAEVAGGK